MTRSELLERAKPILFNTEMIRAILGGRKTVTRRLVKYRYKKSHLDYDRITKSLLEVEEDIKDETSGTYPNGEHWHRLLNARKILPQYKVGDILYVRETWFYEGAWHDLTAGKPDLTSGRYLHRYVYKAESPDYPVDVGVGVHGWKPSIHMPKEAARIFLRVTGVHVELLQDIDDDGVVAEGLEIGAPYDELWDSTVKKSDLAKYGWAANPWVWVIEFERVEVKDD